MTHTCMHSCINSCRLVCSDTQIASSNAATWARSRTAWACTGDSLESGKPVAAQLLLLSLLRARALSFRT